MMLMMMMLMTMMMMKDVSNGLQKCGKAFRTKIVKSGEIFWKC
jgi:hypothetical protein